MKYVILNDGETYTSLKNCIIYDDETGKIYSIRKDKQIGNKDTTLLDSVYIGRKGFLKSIRS